MTVEEYNKIPLNEDILIKYSYKDEEDGEVFHGYYIVKRNMMDLIATEDMCLLKLVERNGLNGILVASKTGYLVKN